jgi:plastocyanin
MRRIMTAVLVLGLAYAAAACSSDAPVQVPFVGTSATVTAANLAFAPGTVSLPAGGPLRIVLDNRDASVPHNLKVTQGGREIAKSSIVSGPAQAEVRFGPLEPGSYQFVCDVHPNMTGTLTITP